MLSTQDHDDGGHDNKAWRSTIKIKSKIKSAPFSPFGAGAFAPSMALALRASSACSGSPADFSP
jgi:hypothetical protein